MEANKKTPPAQKDIGSDEQSALNFVKAALMSVRVPDVPEKLLANDSFMEIMEYIAALREAAYRFARGDIGGAVGHKGFLAGCLKELQSNLRHLTWFANRLAAGDYEQHIDFMGDFSDSFNKMSRELRDALKSLKDSEDRLLKLTKELYLSEERWQLAITCSQDGVWDIDLMAKKAFFSPRLWEIFRRPVVWEDIDFDPVTWGELIYPDDLARWVQIVNCANNKSSVSSGKQYTEFRVMGGDGKYRWIGLHHMVIPNSEGIPCRFVGTCEDIQETREREDEIRRQATHDQLTNLPNRYLYNDRFLQNIVVARRNSTSLVLILWDLDGFKWVNDTFGHLAGDRLLVAVSEVMRQYLRESDTLARFGGDEFVMLLSSPQGQEQKVADLTTSRIFAALSKPLDIGTEKVKIGASCGISFFPCHTTDGEELFNLADRALYEAKGTGKNKSVIWDPDNFDQAKAIH
jgi:diguanylate cyclase (GGDEF)-like protein